MVEWNGIFPLFRFSGILGQPRQVHPKFRNEIPENVCSIRSQTQNFRNFWSNGKRPQCTELNRRHPTFFCQSQDELRTKESEFVHFGPIRSERLAVKSCLFPPTKRRLIKYSLLGATLAVDAKVDKTEFHDQLQF